jgi:hypothetical protein
MNTPEHSAVFQSSERFDPNRIHAAAIYCSDGRFGEQCDDFLHNALKLPRYDRLAVPGGGACLTGHSPSYWEEQALLEQLRFLIKVHGLERVVLIAHQDCAFYTEQLRVAPAELERQQREDMKIVVRRVRSLAPNLQVDAFFARKHGDGTIRFEAME